MTTIGFIGSGHIGAALAQLAAQRGHDVVLSNSRGPETLAALVAQIGPRARAATPEEAAAAGDVVVVTIPLHAVGSVPVGPLAGKVVLDTGNYYPQRDGQIPELDDESATTAELLQRRAPDAHVVKAFSNIGAADILTDARPAGAADRRALPLAADDAGALERAVALVDELGFDTVALQPLAEGWRWQRDTPAYGAVLDLASLRTALDGARRYRDM
ncbi:NADPH-dependent F420 reductase [Cellulomonas endophytica]|uniref:NADPH-dependent F420 reductase n=1 Tax=Cellulomonas endophytica TaxID=2494735 RepID=UPI001013964C|nr:NAD(P)-binding domain-containing protein [Cellulomonas endophytica]